MTVKATLAAISAIPYVVATHKDGEWRVTVREAVLADLFPELGQAALRQKAEAIAHYTDWADDAVGTARETYRWVQRQLVGRGA